MTVQPYLPRRLVSITGRYCQFVHLSLAASVLAEQQAWKMRTKALWALRELN